MPKPNPAPKITVRIIYKNSRSPVVKKFAPTEDGLKQAKILVADQARQADVKGAVLTEATGLRHIFTNRGQYFGTIRGEAR